MENACLYATSHSMQRTDAEDVLREYIARLSFRVGSRVLDIGCGTGDVTAEVILSMLPPGLDHIVGMDVSNQMITHAKNRHANENISFVQLDIGEENENILQNLQDQIENQNNNVTHILSDSKSLPSQRAVDIFVNGKKIEESEYFNDMCEVTDDMKKCSLKKRQAERKIDVNQVDSKCDDTDSLRFDVAFSFYCLHWVQNQKQALKNIHTLLKPGGEALLVILAKAPIFTMYENMAKLPRWSSYMKDVDKFISPYHHPHDAALELSNFATSVGFTVLRIECPERTFTYQESVALRDALIAVSPFFSRLPETEREEYLSDCLQIVRRHKLAEETDNGIRVSYNLLIAHLRK